jgi:hypothetical protein
VDASLTNIQFDAPGFDPVTFEDFSYSLPVDRYTLLDIGPGTPNPALEFGPFTVGAHLPSIDT